MFEEQSLSQVNMELATLLQITTLIALFEQNFTVILLSYNIIACNKHSTYLVLTHVFFPKAEGKYRQLI